MKKPIIDEFTDLPVSRQRKDQLRIKRDDPEHWKTILARKNELSKEYKVRWYQEKKAKNES